MTIKKSIILTMLVILSTPVVCDYTAHRDVVTQLYGPNVRYLLIEPGMGFKLSIVDNVKDDCWTNSKSVRNAVALELARSGYASAQELGGRIIIEIVMTAVGDEVYNDFCVIAINMEVISTLLSRFSEYDSKRNKDMMLVSLTYAPIWKRLGIIKQPKAETNQSIKNIFVNMIQELLVDIPKNKMETLKAVDDSMAPVEVKAYWSNFIIGGSVSATREPSNNP